MRRDSKGAKLHSDERVLLFLSEFSGKMDLWDVPIEVTQKGISKRLGMLENNVSRSLRRLIGDSLVNSELKHVKGERRRQKAYALTPRGGGIASLMRERMDNLFMEVIVDGEVLKLSVARAHRKAREMGRAVTLAELYLHRLRKDRPLDLTPGWGGIAEGPYLVGSYQMPAHFFGREEELAVVNDFLGSGAGVLVIWGIAGMGKTSLILRAMTEARARAGYIRCEPWTDRVELVNEISWVISQMGFEDDAARLLTEEVSPGQLSRKIREVASSAKGLILIIDDLQKTGGGLDIYVEGMCKASMETSGLKVILLTRERPSFLDPRFEIHGSMRSLELKGLDLRSVAMMIKERGGGGDIGAVWDLTKGHPLYVELVLSSLGMGARSRFGEFLDQEVVAPLPPQQRNALELAALSGLPIHRSLIRRTSQEDIDILLRKGLLREVMGGLLYVHDIISDHLRNTIPGEGMGRTAEEIDAYLFAVILRIWGDGAELLSRGNLNKLGAPDTLKELIRDQFSSYAYEDIPPLRDLFRRYLDTALGRIMSSGDIDMALRVLLLLSETSGVGRGKILLGPIMRLERSNLPPEELFRLRLRKANIEVIEGEVESASSTLDLIEATFPRAKMHGRDLALFQHLKGKVSRSQKRYFQTVRSHEKAIETYNKIGDGKGVAKERLHLAKALHQMGDFQRAFKEAIRSASDYEKVLDRKGEVYACLQAYRSALSLGKKDSAERCMKRAREVSRSIGDRRSLALIEMEETILAGPLPDRKALERLRKTCDQIGEEDRDLVVRGYLSIAGRYEAGGPWEEKHLMGLCLEFAWKTMVRVSDENSNWDAGEEGDMESLRNRVDFLELVLSLESSLGKMEGKKLARETGFPFIEIKGEDTRGSLLGELASGYSSLSMALRRDLSGGGGLPGDHDDAVEGLLHTLILLGIHYRKGKRRKKAREVFGRCRKEIKDYERTLMDRPDHIPTFDMRKVKEVLEENRSSLEGEGF